MSHDDAELLRLVREWRPSATLHPIAMQAWHIYEDGELTLPDESIQKIRVILDSYTDDLESLGEALEGLTRFSILLTDRQFDSASAEKVVGLMREYTPLFEPFWARVLQAMTNVKAIPVGPAQQISDSDTGGHSTAVPPTV